MADDFLFPTEKRMEARKVNFLAGDSSRILVQLWSFSRLAWSASEAKSFKSLKNSEVWPMNSPSFVRALAAPIAIPSVSVGRKRSHAA